MKKIALSKLNNDELNTLGFRTDEILAPFPIDEMGLTPYHAIFAERFEKFVTGMKHITEKSIVKQKDTKRDTYCVNFVSHLENYLDYPDDDIGKEAELLLDEIRKFGPGIHRKPYNEETSILNIIIARVKEKYTDLITKTHNVWFDLLDEAQTDFENTLRDLTDSKAKDDVEAASSVRPQLIDIMRKMFTFMAIHFEVTENKHLGEAISKLNIEFSRF